MIGDANVVFETVDLGVADICSIEERAQKEHSEHWKNAMMRCSVSGWWMAASHESVP